eukprot:INCI2075.1.p1 GENE.INCI2075.1~~INCI2075.1.p1  ORF type:complete len:496 (-),score=77.51 INCI2075.1:209-1696(-)
MTRPSLLWLALCLVSAVTHGRSANPAASHHEPGFNSSLSYWEALVRENPANGTVRSMYALLRLRQHGPSPTLLQLLQQCDVHNDWVALQYLAGAHGMIARKVAASGGSFELEQSELQAAAFYFTLAEKALDAQQHQDAPYPQRALAQPRSLTLRSWGDALAWLGQHERAQMVFNQGVAEGVWTTPLCRPRQLHAKQSPSSIEQRHQSQHGGDRDGSSHDDQHYFFNADAFRVGRRFQNQSLLGFMREEALDLLHIFYRNSTQSVLQSVTSDADEAGLSLPTRVRRWREELPHDHLWNPFRDETAGLHVRHQVGGRWLQLVLFRNGQMDARNCGAKSGSGHPRLQRSCNAVRALVEEVPEVLVKEGQIKLSVLAPGTSVRPHCGPVDTRLRLHCALAVPSTQNTQGLLPQLRVGTSTRSWHQNQCFIFDESCEHSVDWFNDSKPLQEGIASGSSWRVVLIVDFANPLLAASHDFASALIEGAAVHNSFELLQKRAH